MSYLHCEDVCRIKNRYKCTYKTRKMKKLLLVNVSRNKGSTGRIAEQIGVVAHIKGWDVYFAHGSRYVEQSSLKSFEVGSKTQDYVHAFIYDKLLGKNGLGSTKATKRLIKHIDEISPDIVHLHNIHGYYLNYRVLFEYLNAKKICVIWTLHDCWCFTGGCTFLNYLRCYEWKSQCAHCPLKGGFPHHSLINRSEASFNLKKELFTANHQLTLVPVSYWLEDLVKQSYLSSVDIKTIHNGVDTNVFKPSDSLSGVKEKYGIEDKKIVLGVASPWSARKGLSDFVCLSERIGGDYQIVLVGLSKQQIIELPSGIIGLERTSSASELAALYSAAFVYVNPTYSDNFPTTNIESLACGTPVITYNTGGSPEAIDEKSGLVVSVGDIEGLIEAIIKIDNIDVNIKSYCRQRALDYFNKENCFNTYIDLYNELLNR